ncbi:SH2 domain protein, partial [Teladorsagia circumcincta]
TRTTSAMVWARAKEAAGLPDENGDGLRKRMSDYDCPTTSVHDLKEQLWYGGLLTRIKSEQILKEDGEFLVRDSISMPGEYVLTAMWNGRALHFQINTICENGKKEFHLEEESFASVPALVNFYRSHRRPITAASGCIISKPVCCDNEVGTILDGKELEASYMHVLRPHVNQVPQPRSLSQRVLLNQTALRQYAAARQQRPKSSISQHQISVAPETVLVPPVPAALVNRPLPLPIRSPRNTQDDEEDYSEMDYDAMDGILDASSLSNGDRARSSSTSSIPRMYAARIACFDEN